MERDEEKQYENEKEHNEKEKDSKGNKIGIWGLVILVVLLALAGAVYGYIQQKIGRLNRTELPPEVIDSNTLQEEEEVIMEEYTNIAVFGVDNRITGAYGSGNSDTIMIVSINNQTKAVKLVSVYRDTYLRIDSDGYYGKANAAYSYNGAAAGISMLNTNFDLNIDQYVSVDWYALVDVIDLLGGVDIEITEQERQKINEYAPEVTKVTGVKTERVTESGLVHLDGVQATAYARIRKLAGNDYRRTQRQRILIENMFSKVKQADFTTLNTIINEVFPKIETNLQMKDILNLAMGVTRYQIISTTGFPFKKSTTTLYTIGDCVVPVNLVQNVEELHAYLFEGENYEVSSEVQAISNVIVEKTGLDIGNAYIDVDSYTTGGYLKEGEKE